MLETLIRQIDFAAPQICTGFIKEQSREIRRTQGRTKLPRYLGAITVTSFPFILPSPAPHLSEPDLIHTLQVLILWERVRAQTHYRQPDRCPLSPVIRSS